MKTHIARTTACHADARPCSRRAEAGFSIIEMLIATAIMMAVTAATFGLMNPAHGMFAAAGRKSRTCSSGYALPWIP